MVFLVCQILSDALVNQIRKDYHQKAHDRGYLLQVVVHLCVGSGARCSCEVSKVGLSISLTFLNNFVVLVLPVLNANINPNHETHKNKRNSVAFSFFPLYVLMVFISVSEF